MPIAYWCLLLAAMLPLLWTGVAKTIQRRHFDNRKPRDFQARLDGMAQRAHWAHLNSFEAFAPFAAGVLAAEQLSAPQGRIDELAIAFVTLRVVYGLCYLANQATLRSLVWAAGMVCTVALFIIAA